MRVKLEATADELEQKGDALLKALASQLEDFNPELAEILEKAADRKKNPDPPTLVLKQIKAITEAEYKAQLKAMLADIGAVLDGKPLRKAFGDPPEKPEPGEEPEEKPEPGDYDPKTDTVVPEPEEPDEDEEEAGKSMVPQYTAGKAGISFPDPGEFIG